MNHEVNKELKENIAKLFDYYLDRTGYTDDAHKLVNAYVKFEVSYELIELCKEFIKKHQP